MYSSGVVKVSAFFGCDNDYYFLTPANHPFAPSNQILCEKNKQTSMGKIFTHVLHISNNVFLHSAEEIIIICVFTANSLFEFSSTESYYKILFNNSAKNNYTYWSSRCKGELASFTLF